MESYKFKKILFNNGIFDKSVDATYIIHLKDNGRYEHIQDQLNTYHPTNIVYILFNKGYKKSKKKEYINSPSLDLVDAFLEIFKHANTKNFNNILILEDDFIFSDKIKLIEHQNNINNTLLDIKKLDFIYLLGCIPYVQIPYNLDNYRVISVGCHAVIYTKENRIKTLNLDQKNIKDWDVYNNQNINRLTYKIPLCYQLFPETENSKVWCKDVNIFMQLLGKIFNKILKLLNLDTNVEPGTSIFYNLSKLLSLFLFLLFSSLIFNKIIQKDFTSIVGFVFILVSIHRILFKKERDDETKNFNFPNYFQYIIILYELITGLLLVFKNKYTNITLKILLLFIIIASIMIMTNHKDKIIETYKDAWTFKPTMINLSCHFLIIFIIIILILK